MDSATGQMSFGTSCGSLAASTFVTLPSSGDWVSFCIQGQNLSTNDKDAIIEVRENRVDGIVLARHPVEVVSAASPAPLATDKAVIVYLHGSGDTIDDYATWTPELTTLTLADPAAFAAANPGATSLTVRLGNTYTSSAANPRGQLLFGLPTAGGGAPSPSAMTPTLDGVNIPADGKNVAVYIAGQYGFPSKADKDAVIDVAQSGAGGSVLARAALMVRIRQDANVLHGRGARPLSQRAHQAERQHRRRVQRVRRGLFQFPDRARPSRSQRALELPGVRSRDRRSDLQRRDAASRRRHAGLHALAPPLHPPARAELQAIDPSVSLNYWNFSETIPPRRPPTSSTPTFWA